MTGRIPLLFYTQHLVGIGHLVRTLALAEALAAQFQVTFLSGGQFPDDLPIPGNIDFVQMPAVSNSAWDQLISLDPALSLDEALKLRRAAIHDTFQAIRPRVVIIEYFPFGRRQFMGELLPLLNLVKSAPDPRPLVFCSLRDIMQPDKANPRLFDDLACTLANYLYDGILVHADPRFITLDETFQPSFPLMTPLYYTGFVVPTKPPNAPLCPPPKPYIVVSAGGGRAGGKLVQTAVTAYAELGLAPDLDMIVVAGPFLSAEEWTALHTAGQATPGLQIVRWVRDFRNLLAGARAAVSQCGYNTMMDILSTRVPALVVPYSLPRESEQPLRARRLAEFGLVRVLEPKALTPATLKDHIEALLAFEPPAPPFALDGAEQTTRLIASLVS